MRDSTSYQPGSASQDMSRPGKDNGDFLKINTSLFFTSSISLGGGNNPSCSPIPHELKPQSHHASKLEDSLRFERTQIGLRSVICRSHVGQHAACSCLVGRILLLLSCLVLRVVLSCLVTELVIGLASASCRAALTGAARG